MMLPPTPFRPWLLGATFAGLVAAAPASAAAPDAERAVPPAHTAPAPPDVQDNAHDLARALEREGASPGGAEAAAAAMAAAADKTLPTTPVR